MKKITFLVVLLGCSLLSKSQAGKPGFDHVEPPNWWIGMKSPSVEIMFHDAREDLSGYTVTTASPGISVSTVQNNGSVHYLFVTLTVNAETKRGNVLLKFSKGKVTRIHEYPLKAKRTDKNRIQGFHPDDVVYLIMPDRFSNGDQSNDSVPGMAEGVHRSKPSGRHGGDLKGIRNHLDYFNELGVTALWLNPVLENKQKRSSYHGYSFTDFYAVDRRFGTNEEYVSLIDQAHASGLKVIQDMVANHIGSEHWLMKDLPDKTWIHQFPSYTKSTFRTATSSDPYASSSDVHASADGWFDTTMPDVNQSNPRVANYLIQNSLWWIEYAGLDGIRMDTYPFNDKDFMARWAKTITGEYPAFTIVGEVWMNAIPHTAYWAKGAKNNDGFESGLPSVTDFPFCFSVPQALNETGGFESGLSRLYNVLSQDFQYPDANTNLTFLDNHDMSRFFLSVGRDLNKYKMGLAFLLTTRGTPEIYYGTELLMDGDANSHPNVRRDFPGGFPGDPVNAFTAAGRTAQQNEAFQYLSKLLHWRKDHPLITNGKLVHYVPEDNIYVYFRKSGNLNVMVILNGNSSEKILDTKRFSENTGTAASGRNIITEERVAPLTQIRLPAMSATVLELEH